MELTPFQRSVLETVDQMQENAAGAAYTTFSDNDSFAIVNRDYLAMLLDCMLELEEIKARPEMVNYVRFPEEGC